VFFFFLLWLGLSGVMGLEITGGVPCSGFYLVWVLLSGLPSCCARSHGQSVVSGRR
jgi:hypothetical protein